MSELAAAKKFEDFTGARFGRLVGVRADETNRRYWLFDCDCGTKNVRVRKDIAKIGATKSCGCLLKEVASVKGKKYGGLLAKDILGMRFSKLFVVARAGSNKDNVALWLCRCDCGNEKILRGDVLRRGDTGSCGCAVGSEIVRSDSARAKTRAQNAKRRRSDAGYAIKMRVLSAVHRLLKKRGGKKDGAVFKLLGYSHAELVKRLKSTIPSGYSWDDFLSGVLEIDHIIPDCVFNYKSVEDADFNRSWSLRNLQLLPREENNKKRASLSTPFQPSLTF